MGRAVPSETRRVEDRATATPASVARSKPHGAAAAQLAAVAWKATSAWTRTAADVAIETIKEWHKDNALRLGAALAYYAIFSIGPLLLVVVAVGGAFFGREAAEHRILETLRDYVGDGGARAVEAAIRSSAMSGENRLAAIVGIGVLVFGATGLFGHLVDALNDVFNVEARPEKNIWAFLRVRLVSFSVLLGTGFLLLVSLVVTAALGALAAWMGDAFPGRETLMHSLNFVISLSVAATLFAMIFKVLPDVRLSWRDVWVGAFVTSLLFTLGQLVLAVYIRAAHVDSAHGAAGSLIVVLVWVYYSSQILFLGAEFTEVFARRLGGGTRPDSSIAARPKS